VGWNNVTVNKDRLFKGVPITEPDPVVYFSHSYQLQLTGEDESAIIATCDYGGPFIAGVRKRNIIGLQFHPEKSQDVGRSIIKRFLTEVFDSKTQNIGVNV
jgi:imidazole glycerol-phosphate synthase subunit HisH